MCTVLYIGNIAHCLSLQDLKTFRGHVAVKDNKIISVGDSTNASKISKDLNLLNCSITKLNDEQILIPGFVDCHVHAPQFPNIGCGLDQPLLEWLKHYTFPLEKQYDNTEFASEVYKTVIQRTLKNGTTTACYFGSLHKESSVILAKLASHYRQRAFVGKVSMNMENNAGYFNTTEKDLQDTEDFIVAVRNLKNDLVEPIITPRFALSCDRTLMRKLSELAKKYNCNVQTHVSENIDEIKAVKEIFPEDPNYCEVYNNVGLLNKCVLAHGVYLEDEEISLLAQKQCSIIHCPASNTRLMSGLCPVRKLLNSGVTIGLGTDVSGGDSSSLLDSVRRCMDVSQHLVLCKGEPQPPISWHEAFYLATLGGAKALFIDDKTGNFQVGKEFDALIIDLQAPNSPIDSYSVPEEVACHSFKSKDARVRNLLQKFIYLGNESNICRVIVKGEQVKVK